MASSRIFRNVTGAGLVALLMILLHGCSSRPSAPDLEITPAPAFDSESYRDAAAQGADVYQLDADRSRVLISVDAAGPLSGLGHKHAISAYQMEAYAMISTTQSRAILRLPLKALRVDEPSARQQLQLEGELDASEIADTKTNMLLSLEADQYPELIIRIDEFHLANDAVVAVGELYLHGTIQPIQVPVNLSNQDGGLSVTGSFKILQTKFGIEPYSALGGGLRVADDLEIEFELSGSVL